MAEEIKFNNKAFLMVPETEGWDICYRIYVDKNPDKTLEFTNQDVYVIISTSLFPNGKYGYGIKSNIVTTEDTYITINKAYASEYEAKLAAYKKIKDFRFSHPRYINNWNCLIESLKMYFEPKNLFDNYTTKVQ